MDQAERLRSRIRETQQKPLTESRKGARVITVTSGKGGVGKTSVSVNLALQFQRMGKKTIIVDADFGLANIEVMLGIHPQYTISDLIHKNMELEDIVTKGPEGIGFISGGSGVSDMVQLEREDLKIVVSKLSRLDHTADVIIIDTGAGISDAVQEFLVSSPEILLVLTPEPTSTMDAYALLKTMYHRKEFMTQDKTIHVVSNRVANEKEGSSLFQNISIVSNRFLDLPLQYLGYIPQDGNVMKAVVQQKPVSLSYPNSNAAKSFQRIAQYLYDIKIEEKNGFLGIVMNLLKNYRDT